MNKRSDTVCTAPRMTSVATTSMGVNNDAAKRKFFQRHDPYVMYYQPRNKPKVGSGAPPSPTSSTCTIYGSAFSPLHRNKRHFLACTSNGCIAVWDTQPSSTLSGSLLPILCVRVAGEGNGSENRVLYDLQFIQTSNGDHLLVVSGDPGVMIYKWSDFEASIDMRGGDDACDVQSKKPKCQDPRNTEELFVEMTPITTFQPHPSPGSECVEINSTSYGKSDGILFGAAGDNFGCYQWDLATEKLLGTFGGGSRFSGGGHRDYLHVVKTIPECVGSGSGYVITGGEDGNMGFWDIKNRKLIEMVNMQTVINKKNDLVTSNTMPSNRGFMSNSSTPWNSGSTNLWVSSMDTNGDWLSVCGGAETTSNSITSRSSGPNSSGFTTLWHLPTRTFTFGSVTRESLNTVVYSSSLDCFVSGGNEGRISFWESKNDTPTRSWITPPATYTMSAHPESNLMVVGGTGGSLDCFVDRVKVSQLQFIS